MKALLTILIILSFLQATILPLNLVLIILLCRSFIKKDKNNLYLCFFLGLLVSHLTLMPLGLLSIIYLIFILITQLLSSSKYTSSSLLILPIVAFCLLVNNFLISMFTNQPFMINTIILIEILLALPIFYLVRLWEERFIVRRDIKLKV